MQPVDTLPPVQAEVVHASEHMTVWVHREHGYVHHQMHKPCYLDSFRAGLLAGVEAMRDDAVTKWLSDDRVNGALAPDDERWAKGVWFPTVRSLGWTHWAIVKPQQVVGQMNLRRFIDHYGTFGITARIFVEPGAAAAWLESV